MALTDKSSIVVPKGFYGKANVLQGFNPQTENLVDLDVVRNTTATRVNEQGLIESVAANVPRRDFLNGGCGDLLVEPQRTNLITYSEDFSNAAWVKLNNTISANATTAPDGTSSADLVISDAGSQGQLYQGSITVNPNSQYILTYFLKEAAGFNTNLALYSLRDETNGVWITLKQTATKVGEVNGFDKYQESFTIPVGCVSLRVYLVHTSTNDFQTYVWGAQLEEGPYPTSYIPTTGSAVTRNQDVISASNIGSLLNDAEGGLFVEASTFVESGDFRITIDDNTTSNRQAIRYDDGNIKFLQTVDGNLNINEVGTNYTANTFNKIAARFKTNDFALFVDGIKEAFKLSGITFADGTLKRLTFDESPFFGRIRQLIVFNNAPTDTEMQTLTTP